MKLKKILLAASALALVAGNAHALTFSVNPGVENIAGNQREDTPATTAAEVVASELNFAAGNIDLEPESTTDAASLGYAFQVNLETGTFTDGQVLRVIVNYPDGMTFGAPVPNSSIRRGDDGGATGDPAGLTISSGGGADDSSVTYLYTAGSADASIGFVMPVQVNSCPAADAMVSVEILIDTSGTAVETNNPIMAAAGITCQSGFTVTVADGGGDIEIELDDNYETINSTLLGTYAVAKTAGVDSDLEGNEVENADIDGFSLDVVFENSAGLATVNTVVIDNTATDATDDANSVDVTGTIDATNANPPIAATNLTLAAAVDPNNAAIAAQSVSATNIALDLSDEFIDPTVADVALSPLVREGSATGPFDWNNEDGPVNSIYRVTGLSTTDDTPMTITYTNSNAGASFNTEQAWTIPAADVNNGEYVITSRGLASTLNPGYGRADLEFFFEAPGIDVDRLISSSGAVGNFGNAAGTNNGDN